MRQVEGQALYWAQEHVGGILILSYYSFGYRLLKYLIGLTLFCKPFEQCWHKLKRRQLSSFLLLADADYWTVHKLNLHSIPSQNYSNQVDDEGKTSVCVVFRTKCPFKVGPWLRTSWFYGAMQVLDKAIYFAICQYAIMHWLMDDSFLLHSIAL